MNTYQKIGFAILFIFLLALFCFFATHLGLLMAIGIYVAFIILIFLISIFIGLLIGLSPRQAVKEMFNI